MSTRLRPLMTGDPKTCGLEQRQESVTMSRMIEIAEHRVVNPVGITCL
ncbi:MAG TPA: hypothetical protein VJH03_19580 [Blastocatellia bacterium]|nr:hypothetical protein [Blastocatellia bacterium]